MPDDDITLRSELRSALDETRFTGMRITMSSGKEFLIEDRFSVTVGQTLVLIDPPDDSHVLLNMSQVSHVDIEPLKNLE